jgi:hypothetical protein
LPNSLRYELKHKPWFDEGYSELLDQMRQAKLQWLQDPSEVNGDNLNSIRCEAGRHIGNKTLEYLKDKINELISNSSSSSYIATNGQSASSSWCQVSFGAHDQILILLCLTVTFVLLRIGRPL